MTTASAGVLEQYFSRERELTPEVIEKLPWDTAKPAGPELAGMLHYMMQIEAHTPIVYYPSLLYTPSAQDPAIASFMERWSREETTHGELLSRYLVHAAPDSATYIPPQLPGAVKRKAIALPRKLLGETFITLHMVWGAINEITTEVGYTILWKETEDLLLRQLLALIRKEEAQHAKVYLGVARDRLNTRAFDRWLVPRIVKRFWRLVGSHDEDRESMRPMLRMLERALPSFKRRVEGTIRLLPGCDSLDLASIAQQQLEGSAP